MSRGQPVWYPRDEYVKGSHLQHLMARLQVGDYEGLYQLSIVRPEVFWAGTLAEIGIEWFEPYREFVDLSRGPQWPRWFVGGRLNLAHNALTRHARGVLADRTALIWEGEEGRTVSITYRELEQQVVRVAAGLRELGLRPGDRVGIFLPMIPQAAISVLAVARLGGIIVPVFSGYGPEAVATRLRDSGARFLITADGFARRGRPVPLKSVADEATATCPSLERVLVVRHLGNPVEVRPGRDVAWDEITQVAAVDPLMESMDPNDPFMLVYTSGTTGKPKGTVHIHGGFPFKMTQDFAQLFDLRRGDVLFWVTDMGWVMGPGVIISGLTLGATVVMYSGAPDYPHVGRIWEIVEKHRVTHLGLAPTLVRSLRAHGEEPLRRYDLESLRVLPSTGEPWDPESYEWYFREVGRGRLPISNYSGGTEISGGILGCVLHRPIKATGFNTVVPGIAAAVLDSSGRPVRGEVGDLAILKPFVGMTQGFWQDPGRYLDTYWNRFPGIWVHGDWALCDEDGHWFLFGRSDDTIKVAGKRIGPAEVEAAANQHPGVAQSAAIGVPHPVKGSAIVVFVVPRPGVAAGGRLEAEVAEAVGAALGKSMVPQAVHVVADLPRTRNAKLMRRVIRAVYLGEPPGDLSSLENPESLSLISAVAGKGQ